MLEIKECSPIGQQVLDEKQTLIVGISINNSYFKEPNLEKVLVWASRSATSVYIMIPDEPSVFTLMALGYEQEKAQKEARLKSNNLENKCLSITRHLKLPNITVIRWSNLIDSVSYLEALVEIKYAYNKDENFKYGLRRTTDEVIKGKLLRTPTSNEIDLGTMFLLQELAFICRSTVILKQQKVAYVYHKTMQVMKDIFEDHYLFKTSNIGFITAE